MLDFVSIHWFHDWENMFLFKYKVKYWLWTTISKCLQCFSILSKHECVHAFPWVRGHIVYHGPSWSIMVHHGPSVFPSLCHLVPISNSLRPSRQWTFAIDRSPGFVCTNSKYFHWLRGTFFPPLKFLISAWCFLPSLAWILLEWQRLETAVSQHLHISELLKSTYSETAHLHCKRDILPVQLKSNKIRTDVNFWLHLRDILLLELVEAPLQVWHACISLLASRLL